MAPTQPRPGPTESDVITTRRNFFGGDLAPVNVPQGGQTTGFFRNNYCDASPLDPGSHTVAAVINSGFLEYSASQGNDLRPLFPTSGPLAPTSDPLTSPCRWCLCASRWAQAVKAAATGQLEERFVPRIILESTHQNAIRDAGGISRADFERYAVGGDGVAQGGGPGPHGHGGGGGGHHGQANRGNVGR